MNNHDAVRKRKPRITTTITKSTTSRVRYKYVFVSVRVLQEVKLERKDKNNKSKQIVTKKKQNETKNYNTKQNKHTYHDDKNKTTPLTAQWLCVSNALISSLDHDANQTNISLPPPLSCSLFRYLSLLPPVFHVGETRRAPFRQCRDARVHGHTFTAVQDNEYPVPLPLYLLLSLSR